MLRLLTGLMAGFFWLLVIVLNSSPILYGVISLAALIALREYYQICLVDEDQFVQLSAIAISIWPLAFSFTGETSLILCGFIVSLLFQSVLVVTQYPNLENPFLLHSKISFGTLYITLGATHLYLLSTLADGWFWIFLLSIIICASDSGAYYVGTPFGKRKLCPSVSPGKTIEGLFGGMSFAIIASIVSTIMLNPELPLIQMSILAVFLSGLGVIGDLTESIFKRAYKIKDSGSILPGHGGILDRVDSILLTAPALFYILYFISPN